MAVLGERNYLISHPSVSFVNWCETKTSHLFTPLPEGQEGRELLTRIAIIASIVIPIIGLVAMLFSAFRPASLNRFTSLDRQEVIEGTRAIEPNVHVRDKCREKMPVFYRLVNDYQAGVKLSIEEYELQFIAIMTGELGYLSPNVYRMADTGIYMEPHDVHELLMAIIEKLEIKEFIFDGLDARSEGLDPCAYLLRGDGHNSVAILQDNGRYLFIPELILCEDFEGDREASDGAVTREPFYMGQHEFTTDDMSIYAPGLPVHQGVFTGEIPNINSCAMEACIFLFAALLPPSD